MSSSLPAPYLQFADGEPQIAAAKALTLTKEDGLALVALLVERRQRGHLAALGEVASVKDVKKAARSAAYKLEQQGVAAQPLERAGHAIDLSVTAELDRIAIAAAPGSDGHLWVVLAALPGAGGGEIDARASEQGPRFEVVEDLAVGRVRRSHAQMMQSVRIQRPVLADAHLVVRLIAAASPDFNDVPKWPHFAAWHDRALKLGADPTRWDARAHLGPAGRPVPATAIESLGQHPIVGYIAPPEILLAKLDSALSPLMHGHGAIAKEDFMARYDELIRDASVAWLGIERERLRWQRWLDATADVLFFAGETEYARVALALGDDLVAWDGAAGGQHPLVAYAFASNMDAEAAWAHRESHMKGEANH